MDKTDEEDSLILNKWVLGIGGGFIGGFIALPLCLYILGLNPTALYIILGITLASSFFSVKYGKRFILFLKVFLDMLI